MFQINHASMLWSSVHWAAGHVFPQAGLPRAGYGHDLDARFEQVLKAADALGVAGAHQDRRRAQVQRAGIAQVEHAGQGGGEAAHHVFSAAEQHVGILPGLVGPRRRGAGRAGEGGAVGLGDSRGGGVHGRRGAAGAVHIQVLRGPCGGGGQRGQDHHAAGERSERLHILHPHSSVFDRRRSTAGQYD
ncbi:hypothetical protein G6F57_019969 [Rhizopus arrhizus]|nr:hypothetical protein G6F57_019969 [Rhizopus arrhizus]